jgi:hypothetical protein
MILEDYDLSNVAGGGGRWDWETDPVLQPNPRGFDTLAATICFRGSISQLNNLYDLGAQNAPGFGSSRELFYAGPTVRESRFGYLIADLQWAGYSSPQLTFNGIGLLGSGVRVNSIDLGVSPEESLWPQERDGVTVILPAPYAPPGNGIRQVGVFQTGGTTVALTAQPWRVRLLGRRYTYSVRGSFLATRNQTFKPPTLNLPNPYTADPTAINWQAMPDPLVTYAEGLPSGGDGWWTGSHRVMAEYTLGDRKLQMWEADYEWVRRYGP